MLFSLNLLKIQLICHKLYVIPHRLKYESIKEGENEHSTKKVIIL